MQNQTKKQWRRNQRPGPDIYLYLQHLEDVQAD